MKRKFSKSERRLLLTSGLLMAGLLGFGGWWTWSNADPQITIAARPAPPEPNAFDFYVKARSKMVWTIGKANEVNLRDDLLPDARNPQQFLKTFPLKSRILWLARNKAAFQLTRQGFAYDCQVPEDDYYSIYGLSYLFKTECRVRAAQGNWNSAAQSALDNVHFGVDFCKGAAVPARNLSRAIIGYGLHDLEAVVESIDATTARAATKKLRQLMDEYPSTVDTLKNDKAKEQKQLMELFATKEWRRVSVEVFDDEFAQYLDKSSVAPTQLQALKDKSISLKIFLRGLTLSKQTMMKNYTNTANAAIAAAQQPYKPLILQSRDNFSDLYAHIYPKIIFSGAKTRTRANLIETALALRAYKLEKGSYPTSLNALVPTYLPSVPQDVFANKPLQYKREGASYKLWSIGPDGRDDRGKPARGTTKFPNQQTVVDSNSSGDFVFGVNR